MKKSILLFAFVLTSIQLFGQTEVGLFNRMFIYNDSSEIMLVKIKGTELWVTPGLYQNKKHQYNRQRGEEGGGEGGRRDINNAINVGFILFGRGQLEN